MQFSYPQNMWCLSRAKHRKYFQLVMYFLRCQQQPVDNGDKMKPIPLPVTSRGLASETGQCLCATGLELSVFLKSACLRAQSVECSVRPLSACDRGEYCARKLECQIEENVDYCTQILHFRYTALDQVFLPFTADHADIYNSVKVAPD